MNEKVKGRKPNFDINSLSSREFQAFLILLTFEGEELPLLKTSIDLKFGHKSRTKGYDYINDLVKKGYIYKKKAINNGKKNVRIITNKKVRSEYEKFIVPTLSNTKKIVQDIIQDNLSVVRDIEKNREKFRKYTETIIDSVKDLIDSTPPKNIKSNRFQKKMDDLIWKLYKAEMLKSEMFSR